MKCARCNGKGWSGPVHINMGDGKHEWRERMECYDCGGSGNISEEQANARSVGRLHMTERMVRGESLRECSKRIGVGAAALCDYEHGRTWTEGYMATRAALAKAAAR